MTVQEAGGVETLKSEASSYGGPGARRPQRPRLRWRPLRPLPLRRAVERTARRAHDHGESAADEATEAASDATSDEPSTERES